MVQLNGEANEKEILEDYPVRGRSSPRLSSTAASVERFHKEEINKEKPPIIYRPVYVPHSVYIDPKEKIPLLQNYLLLGVSLSVIAGFGIGALLRLRQESYAKREVFYIKFPGELFFRCLRLFLIPYVSSSVISSVGKLNAAHFKRISFRLVAYSLLTTLSAALTGVILNFIILNSSKPKEPQHTQEGYVIAHSFLEIVIEIFMNLLPNNIITACLHTEYITIIGEGQNKSAIIGEVYQNKSASYVIKYEATANFLGIVMFCVLIGLALHKLGPLAEWFVCLTDSINELMAVLMSWVLWLAPISLLFVIIGNIVQEENWNELLNKMMFLIVLFFVGTVFHCLVILPLIFFVITRQNPFSYICNYKGIVAAFASASSVSALPFMLVTAKRCNIDDRISQLVFSLRSTFGRDGNALLFTFIAVRFIEDSNLEIDSLKVLEIVLFAMFTSSDSAVMDIQLLTIARRLGIDTDTAQLELHVLLSVTWFLQRIQTTINVYSDAIGAKIIDFLSVDDLPLIDYDYELRCKMLTSTREPSLR